MKNQFNVLITGDSDFFDYQLMKSKLDTLLSNKDNVVIVSGMNKIGYTLCEKYARFHNFSIIYYPSYWSQNDTSAISEMNEILAKKTDAIVYFWNGLSDGKKHILNTAETINLPLRIILY